MKRYFTTCSRSEEPAIRKIGDQDKIATVTAPIVMKVPFFDLHFHHAVIQSEIEKAIHEVLETQKFILGNDVSALETEIAGYCGTRHAIACASGSDAILLSLLALGIGPNDEVLTTPYSFFATAGYIVRAGATPVFADIDPRSFNLDPGAVEAVLDLHPKIRAIMPVHLFGACADMGPLLKLATARGLPVIEDAAQAIGAEWNGQRAGSLGASGCFSFFPSKNLGAYGDGGIVTTNDASLAGRVAALRVHGSRAKYYHDYVGLNSRLDSLQAAILRVKLRHLDHWTEARQRNADFYRQHLAGLPVTLPSPAAYNTRHVYNQFVIRSQPRDELRVWLSSQGIGTEIYYPLPLHLQACFASLGYREGDFPVSEEVARTSLALPIFPELTAQQIESVCSAIREFFTTERSSRS
jgi:dTDP-4-amino-4,6-dideoxygalactose transaminase